MRQYKHLHGLELAGSGPEDQTKIDVLLGSDCYWSVVTGQMIAGDQGPVALDSKLGWLLSGLLDGSDKVVSTHSHMIIHGSLIDSSTDEGSNPLVSMLQRFWNV